MTLRQVIDRLRGEHGKLLESRAEHTAKLAEFRKSEVDGETVDSAAMDTVFKSREKVDSELASIEERIARFEAELLVDDAAAAKQRETAPTGASRPAYDEVARVGAEARTYRPDFDRSGGSFLRDVGQAFIGNYSAQDRIRAHMREEEVERGQMFDRAAGTGAFAGLVVPQYLTDLYAPQARANRPFADVCNHHDLPPSGMTVNISRITTGTSAANQTENAATSETNIDDTLLTINVLTSAGQQTLSRQAIERGTGIEGAMLDDLYRANATNIDSTLINQSVTGLSAVATAVTYTDASPTAAELYPKVLESLAGVEAALLDQDPGDNIAIMHSRRWYWMMSQVGSTWPFVQQPGIAPQMGANNLAERYGGGFRGVLPNGTPVVVDNNISTVLGAGTEDEIYVGSTREFHLWEDPSAPMLIRAEQTPAASLGVLFVVYSYYAYTHIRYAQARKISGTGLIAPTF